MENTTLCKSLELWGGIECTINRIGNEFKDQLIYSGHYQRPGDLEEISKLGIKAIRYPVLWEKHQPERNQRINWAWSDKQLNSIRSLGILPIAGLLHHGSGPAFTDLLDPEFPYLLAAYAYEVASRYPWLEYYTPVNEPLTTARFSGLYGLWYPHHKSEGAFYKMLINQLKGTVLSMEAIQSINPLAKLVQTEDIGKTHSTKLLSYQADFENVRRYLTFDILTGKLTPDHPHYDYILGCGIPKEELDFFQYHRVTPAVLGLNYYITSERWLDERVENYHSSTHGGNGRHRYADTEMVRASGGERAGLTKLASEIWERYHIPLAITEAHLHCTREEQLRWFQEVWNAGFSLIENGVDVRAVTAWALLGSFDWDTLLTKTGSQYESGVYDIKTFPAVLRPTALATLLKTLSAGEHNFHPVLSEQGWWHGRSKLTDRELPVVLLVTGGEDNENYEGVQKLSKKLEEACHQRRIKTRVVNRIQVKDINKNIWAVISISDVDPALASVCSVNNIQYVTFNNIGNLTYGMRVLADFNRLSIHQLNKVLDLMIDGEQGNWLFDRGEISYKAENQPASNDPVKTRVENFGKRLVRDNK